MDRLAAMRLFVAVAQLGSFAEAGRRHRLSASVVTRSIARLEEELGLTLLNRTTRSVRVTERGQIYLESCRQILEDLDAAESRARGENAAPRGLLRVSAPIVFGRFHVLPIVNRLLIDHPALAIRLTLSDRNLHLVEDGIDLAVRIGDLADSSLIAVRLGSVGRITLASPAYLERRGEPSHPQALSAHDLIAFDTLDVTSEWQFKRPEDSVRIDPRLAVNSADAALAAAAAGIGITRCLSYQAEDALRSGRLVRILEMFEPAPLPISAVYPAHRVSAASVTAFVKTARAHFKEHPVSAPGKTLPS
jgi:DNA-binding transcriptional LysR family regulator